MSTGSVLQSTCLAGRLLYCPRVVTDLLVLASGVSPDTVSAAVPPACRSSAAGAPRVSREGDDWLLDFPEWRPRVRARHLLPSFAALTELDYSFRFEVSVLARGAWSPWSGLEPIGPASFPPLQPAPGLETQVDFWLAGPPAERVRLRVRLRGGNGVLAAPWLAALSASDLAPPPGPAAGRTRPAGPSRRARASRSVREAPRAEAVRLAVPPLSQREARPEIAMRICSPAGVAMVLRYFGARADLEALAADVFHPALDRYGVWPAAIAAAARHGVLGYLLRFPDWEAAAWCLRRGLPVVASVRYAAGELTGAALSETAGHLLVLTGYEGDEVLVNDPAAPADAVGRRYRRDELVRAWLGRAGVGYVLFRPE